MTYRLRRTSDRRTVEALHMLTMPGDEFDLEGQLWLCHDDTGTPVAFCSARHLDTENLVFLSRAGVLPCANGHRLQRRMIQARLKWAREVGADCAITYTTYENHASIGNLLKSGFKFYMPARRWVGDVHYFYKNI